MFGFGRRRMAEKAIMIDTEIFTNAVFDAVVELGLDKEEILTIEDLRGIIRIVFSHPQVVTNIPSLDNMFMENAIQTLAMVINYGAGSGIYCYPGTVADILSRGYATALLGGTPPDNNITQKMIDIEHSKFDNLGKL